MNCLCANAKRVTSTLEPELKELLVEYAKVETDCNESFAIRKILREYLERWKKKK